MYRWNLDNIKEKQKYVQDRLKNDSLDDNERKKLELTLLSYYGIISNSGGIHITQIANLDILRSKGKGFSLIHNTKYKQIKEKHSIKEFAISDDYLSFLILICNNLSNKYIEMGNLDKVDIAEKEIVDISRKFYESFDEEMSDIATRALSPEKSFVNFSDTFNPAYEGAFGITFHDYLFNESYFTVKKSSTLYDLISLNHEVMHGIEFQMRPKLFDTDFYGFHEIATHTTDLIFLDYLHENNLYSEYVDEILKRKLFFTEILASKTVNDIKRRIAKNNNINILEQPNFEFSYDAVKEIIGQIYIPDLLELVSILVSQIIFNKYKNNKVDGLETLKNFIRTPLPKDETPSFDHLGITKEDIILLSENYYSTPIEQNKKQI